jgi:hypothetical protein
VAEKRLHDRVASKGQPVFVLLVFGIDGQHRASSVVF